MKKETVLLEESTLDPKDWAAMKELGHRMLDDMFEYIQSARKISMPWWKQRFV